MLKDAVGAVNTCCTLGWSSQVVASDVHHGLVHQPYNVLLQDEWGG